MLRKIIGIIIVFSFMSCDEVKEIDLKLEKLTPETTFRLDTINISHWDSLYIVTPYGSISSGKYDMPESVLNKINSMAMYNDSHYTLLFIKNNKLVNYSIVGRNVVDFALLKPDERRTFPSNQEYKLDAKRIATIP